MSFIRLMESSGVLITCFYVIAPFTGSVFPCPLVVFCPLCHVHLCWHFINMWNEYGSLSTLASALSEQVKQTCNLGFSNGKRVIRNSVFEVSGQVVGKYVSFWGTDYLCQSWRGFTKPVPTQSKEQWQEAMHLDSSLSWFNRGLTRIGTTIITWRES